MKTEIKYKKCCLCIITKNKKNLLQLRDSKKYIKDPNTWGLFGGHLKKGEKPKQCIKRELKEELSLNVNKINFLFKIFYLKDKRECYIFHTKIINEKFKLLEGKKLGFFTTKSIIKGLLNLKNKKHNITYITVKAFKKFETELNNVKKGIK